MALDRKTKMARIAQAHYEWELAWRGSWHPIPPSYPTGMVD